MLYFFTQTPWTSLQLIKFFCEPGIGKGAEYYDEHVCLSVCLHAYLKNRMSELDKVFAHVACDCGLILLWWHHDILYTFSFVCALMLLMMIGWQDGHLACKMSGGLLALLPVWDEVQVCRWPSWCHCHSLSLAQVKSRLILPLWYRLSLVFPDKGLLNRCCGCCCFQFCRQCHVFL